MSRTNRRVVGIHEVSLSPDELSALSRKSEDVKYDPGGGRWIDREADAIITESNPEGVPDDYVYVAPDESVGDEYDVVESPHGATYRSPEPVDTDDESDEGDSTDPYTEAVFSDVPDAGPTDLAGGIPAAIDDSRDDFHDIRNAIVDAESRSEALDIIDENLTTTERKNAARAVERQQRMRDEFDAVDDPTDLEFGQRILADGDRPITGYVDDVDADGTVWINYDDRDLTSGRSVDSFTIYADPGGGDGQATEVDVSNVEPGRFGLASSDEVLENPFASASDVVGSREAGIDGGNTTGEDMKILEQPDGSRVFATPAAAYDDTPTVVVSSREEAIRANKDGPKVIEAFGGDACDTRIVEYQGDDYIVKEGVDGELVNDVRQTRPDDVSDAERESMRDTMAAAYFQGNKDLHGANRMFGEDGNVYVIDHDSQTTSTDLLSMTVKWNARADVEGRINELAREYAQGDIELPDDVDDRTERTVRAQVEGAIQENPEEVIPGADSPPDEAFDPEAAGLEEGDEITYLDDGRIRRTEVVEYAGGPYDILIEPDGIRVGPNPHDILGVET